MAKETQKTDIKFLVCGDTTPPARRRYDAGIDVFIPNLTEQFVTDLMNANPGQPVKWGVLGIPDVQENPEKPADNNGKMFIYLGPHCDLLIPTYVKARIPEGTYLRVADRSSIPPRQKLVHGSEVIDPSFEGIIFIHVINFSNDMRFLSFGQKLAQLIPEKYIPSEIENYYQEGLEQFKEYRNITTLEKFYEGHDEGNERRSAAFGSTDGQQQAGTNLDEPKGTGPKGPSGKV